MHCKETDIVNSGCWMSLTPLTATFSIFMKNEQYPNNVNAYKPVLMTWFLKLSVVIQWLLLWITIFMILWFNSRFLWNDSLLHSCHWHIQSFFGQTGIYLEPPWLALSEKFFENCASRCSKNAYPRALCVLGFLCM